MNMPPRSTEIVVKKPVMYRTMNCVTKKIENGPNNGIHEILSGITDKVIFVKRAKF